MPVDNALDSFTVIFWLVIVFIAVVFVAAVILITLNFRRIRRSGHSPLAVAKETLSRCSTFLLCLDGGLIRTAISA